MAKIPAAWGNRPICNTPAELLAWLDRQAAGHVGVLQQDRCRVTSCGANTGEADVTYHVSPEVISTHQRVFASDIQHAHDWLDANPTPTTPQRPVGLESGADGSEAMTERIVAEYSKLCRVLASAANDAQRGPGAVPAVLETGDVDLKQRERAMALLIHHPEWTLQAIADAVPCSRTSLYRWSEFMKARAIIKSGRNDLPKGSKDAETGSVEAWD